MDRPGRPSTRTGSRPTPGRATTLFWIVVWMAPLLGPVLAVPDVDPVGPAAAGLAGFLAGYVAVLWSAFCWPYPDTDRTLPLTPLRLAALGVVAALGVALAAGYAGGPGDWLVVLLYVGVAGAASLPVPRVAIGWLAGTVLVLVLVASARDVPAGGVGGAVLSTVLAGVLVLTLRRMADLIAHLRRTRAVLAETAVRNERLRFSRDLHDLLGHTLSLIVVKAELIRRSAAGQDPGSVQREAAEVEQVGRRALAEVREAVTGYRERAFAAELDAARSALTDAGLRVTVRASGTPLPAPADSLLGWAVREAATNVVRHSGARHCQIEVRRADGSATLEVRDDGVGGAVHADESDGSGGSAGSGGLAGLAERLAEAGGQLAAGGTPHGGWRLAATVPVSSR